MAQQIFRIPLENVPQRFTIDLAERSYQITCRFNTMLGTWLIDVADGNTQAPILASLPLVTGGNLLRQFQALGIPGAFVVYTDGDEGAVPTLENLGAESNLYYVVDV